MGFDGLDEGVAHATAALDRDPTGGRLGREAVRMLLTLIEDPDRAPMQRFLPTRLTLRRSCGCEIAPAVEDLGGGVEAETALSLV